MVRGAAASENVPEHYRNQLGGIPQPRLFRPSPFLEGGTIVTIGSSTALAQHPAPVTSALTETDAASATRRAEHPLLRPRLSTRDHRGQQSPIALACRKRWMSFSPIAPPSACPRRPETYANRSFTRAPNPAQRLGMGQRYLNGAVAIAESDVGEGRCTLRPEITFWPAPRRSQVSVQRDPARQPEASVSLRPRRRQQSEPPFRRP